MQRLRREQNPETHEQGVSVATTVDLYEHGDEDYGLTTWVSVRENRPNHHSVTCPLNYELPIFNDWQEDQILRVTFTGGRSWVYDSLYDAITGTICELSR